MNCEACGKEGASRGLCDGCWRRKFGWSEAKLPHLSWEECLERWPNVVKCLQWVLIGTSSEAACCIRDYRDGCPFGSEAVSHSGLTPLDRVRHACSDRVRAANRHRFRGLGN